VLALTPVAALMFRYNHPDALLVLLLVAGGYAVTRAVEKASWRWLALAGALVGLGFLTKMMQAFLVLPAFALAYLLAAPTSLGRRIAHVAGAGVAVVVSSGWYIALVALWPAGSRPYIAGSANDSLLELALGYNGLGRIFGGDGNMTGGGGMGGNTGFGGATGLGRMFGAAFGTEVSWLLPAALIALGAGLWFSRGLPRTDRTRAALLLWGGWLLVTGLVFSLMSGIVHPYYAVALAPAIGALVGIAGAALWRGRANRPAAVAMAAMVAVTAVWSAILLARNDSWLPWLRWAILAAGVLVATALVVGGVRLGRWVAAAAVVVALAGSGAYAVATAAQTHSGSIPVSGPASSAMGGGTGPGGTASDAVAALLAATDTTWAAATTGGTSAAELELASGKSVIAIGGWNGGDPSPTLAEFKAYVAEGKIAYYLGGGGMGGPGGDSEIAQWVADNYESTTVGGATVYDLT
jgi:4-amino-4-deoxy-L-arabinose transferase-like glycosyltransferase